MNEIANINPTQLETVEDLSRFVLIGRDRLAAVRAAIRAIDKVGVAAEVYQQKLAEGQEIAEAVLDAEVRLGELRKSVARSAGGRPEKTAPIDGNSFKTEIQAFDEKAQLKRTDASRLQTMAAHPDAVEAAKAKARDEGRIVTRQDVLNVIKEDKRKDKESAREAQRQENAGKIQELATPLEAKGLFQTIVIDPPWDWGDEGDVNQMGRAKPDYHTMPIEEIMALPVGQIADENCHLYLWTTNRSLPKAFRLLEAWGFRYITCITWVKPYYGMGNYFRGDTEQILFGVKGSQPLKRKDVGTHFEAPRGKGHSAKPEEFYTLVESCSYGPYIDIFGRRGREGWSVWGENG